MDFRQSEIWRRHQLATLERIQSDVGRLTRPVMCIMGISSLAYLLTWGPLVVFWKADDMPLLLLLMATLSAGIVMLTAPVFTLAVGIENYFKRRLRPHRTTRLQTH